MILFHNTGALFLLLIVTVIELNVEITNVAASEEYSSIEIQNVCRTRTCNETAAEILNNMDRNVKPCEDFYKFACGGFINKINTSVYGSNVNSFTLNEDKLSRQLKKVLEEPSPLNEFKPFKLAKNYYKSCMNEQIIEQRKYKSLHKILKELGGWPVLEGSNWNETDFYWTDSVIKLGKVGYSTNYFISLDLAVDLKNSTKKILEFGQSPKIHMREYLLDKTNNSFVKAYHEYMVDIATMLGASEDSATAEELQESLDFKIKLTEISLSDKELLNETTNYNPMTIDELSKNYPSIPWKNYANNILAPHISVDDHLIVNVIVPNFISKLEQLIKTTPKRVQANYIMWEVVESSMEYLTQAMLKRRFEFLSLLDGNTKMTTRWIKCVKGAKTLLSTHALYVQRYFNEAARNNAIGIANNINNQLKNILQTVDWMDDETRNRALDKAAAVSFIIGYPAELVNNSKLEELYKNLDLNEDNYLENHLKVNRHLLDDEYSDFKQPFSKISWKDYGSVAILNAFYHLIRNSIIIPAGILQGSFFNNDRPNYMNYGSIGFVIGHEITHGFDNRGRQMDEHGNLNDWWTSSANDAFIRKTDCFVHQYNNYTIKEIKKQLNGRSTQSENIGDTGGFKIAYLAYKDWSRRHTKEQSLPGLSYYTPQQMYWISAANMWCSKSQSEFLEFLIKQTFYCPAEFRILGSFSNLPEFAKDFNCPEGSTMNPKNKCNFW